MKFTNRALYVISRFITVDCEVVKKSKYYNEYMVQYIDPFLGGESEEWVPAFKIKRV